MTVEPASAGARFPPPLVYLAALLSALAAERFVTLRSFGIDWLLPVVNAALNPCRSERVQTYSRQCDRPLQWTWRSARLWHPVSHDDKGK